METKQEDKFYHIRCIDPNKDTWLGYMLCYGTIDKWERVNDMEWGTVNGCQFYTQKEYGIKARYI